MKTALSIAGTDPSGGAGIQADLKTMTLNGVFAMSAITALVAQNTTGVREIVELPLEFLGQQIDVVFEDIPPDAVKIGMVASCGLIEENRGAAEILSGKKHCGGPGDGGHQRRPADLRGGGGHAEKLSASPGGCGHPQHSRGGDFVRYDHPQSSGH